MDPIYDTIGSGYTATRAADARVVDKLVGLLSFPQGARILDVGAGTGNYSQALADRGFEVTALEPSQVMRTQGKQHPRLSWMEGVAEALPFASGSYDGIVMTLCVHHFSDWKHAMSEAVRVVNGGPIVILGFDAHYDSGFWLFDYFPEFSEKDREWFPRVDELKSCFVEDLGRQFEVHKFPLPANLKDRFAASGWSHPEWYLDECFRAGISSFSVTCQNAIASGLERLSRDLKSGEWDRRYSSFREQRTFDAGYRFFKAASND